jgi:hypothetical protein
MKKTFTLQIWNTRFVAWRSPAQANFATLADAVTAGKKSAQPFRVLSPDGGVAA